MSHQPQPFSRRRFFAGAAAACVVPVIVPRHVLGNAYHLPANEKIVVGAIGIGKMLYGSHLPHFLKMPEVKVVAVSDVDTTRRQAGKSRVDETYGNTDCAAYNDYRELIGRDDIDAVVCATPDHWHAMVILETCKARKDMYCEKPLTNNLMEAKSVMDAVSAAGIIFQTGSQQRAGANFRKACELVRNGYIGDILRVEVSVGGPPRPCDQPGEAMEPGLDWDRWLGPAPVREYSSVLSPRGMHDHFPAWRKYCEYGGGGMTDWGAHHFDIAQWGLGMDQSGPVEIVPPENPRATSGVKFVYDNGIPLIHGGNNDVGFGVRFYGSKGNIYVDRGRQKSTINGLFEKEIGEDEVHLYEAPGGGHSGHRQDWINCVRSRQQPNCPIEVGARTVAVCHLGNIAYMHAEQLAGQSLKWDPQQWQFVGSDEANAWRDYPYPRRDGYELPAA